MDKNKAVIQFLLDCPAIRNNPLYFNFINAKNDNKQILTTGNDRAINRSYLDGSVLKRYIFTLVDWKSVAYRPIVKTGEYPDENVEEMLDVQGIVDWVNDQASQKHYPDFGEDCEIQDMFTLTDNPNLNGIDSSTSPVLAKYTVSIRIDYLDTSQVIWGK